jgi:hypothetical protein
MPHDAKTKPHERHGQGNSDANHGEGNPEAAAHFNKAEHEFVASKRGQRKIREAGNVRPEEEAELEQAERATRAPQVDSGAKETRPKERQR